MAKERKKRAPNRIHKLPVGRPQKYDLKEEAKLLLEWSAKKSSLSLYEFTRDKDYLAAELTDFAAREPEFALALKKAKENVGQNRENGCNLNTVNYGVWGRWASIYQETLNDHEEEKEIRKLEKSKLLEKYKEELKAQSDISKQVAPTQSVINSDDENMRLKNENRILKERLEAKDSNAHQC